MFRQWPLSRPALWPFLAGLVLALGLPAVPSLTATLPQEAPVNLATVSGTISHAGSPVAAVDVTVSWDGGSQTVTTAANGLYSVGGVPTGDWIDIRVRPPLALRLVFRNWRTEILAGDLVKDFDLQSGNLLQGQIYDPAGSPYTGFPPQLVPVMGLLPDGEYYGPLSDPSGAIQQVLPADGYAVLDSPEQAPLFTPPTIIDLQSGDVTDRIITLSYRPEPIPSQPPDASKITIGPPDLQGMATVAGTAGAVPPYAVVAVINLNGFTLDVTVADGAGAFTTHLYAPPGSSLLAKYDVSGRALPALWAASNQFQSAPADVVEVVQGDTTLLPGTMLYAGPLHPGSGTVQPFDTSSVFLAGTRSWAGLWLSGTLRMEPGGLPGPGVLPGETITLTADLRATSPNVTCTPPFTFTVRAHIKMQAAFDGSGRALPGMSDFSSYLSTPTGLPIEQAGRGDSYPAGSIEFDNWQCGGSHSFDSQGVFTFTVPLSLTEGIYEPHLIWENHGLPLSSQLPQITTWYHFPHLAILPPLTVGQPAAPRIPWMLLADYPVNGYRGVQALEDAGHYQTQTWVVFPPGQTIIPRLDERTGQPLVYRLEPGSNWLTSTDRRIGFPLHLPMAYPSGSLAVDVHKPDGSVDVLGPAVLNQASVRTPGTPGGVQLGIGTGTLGDVYHLTTMNPAFDYSFDQEGLYFISVFGNIEDIYGNHYALDSSYELKVAHILELEPGELPGTPYIQGDAFAPGVHIRPPVPADVTIQLVHMPYSDPGQAITHTISGQANAFGYFQPPAGTDIRLQAPGEFRVDIKAQYTDPDGTMWAGHMTWGQVVEGLSPMMAAHGRHGMDYVEETIDDMPAWFLCANLPTNKIGPDTYYPYFNSDIYWGGVAPCDSIQPTVTIKDLTGASETIYNIVRNYLDEATSEFRRPPSDTPSLANLEKRIAIGEAPLFIATEGGVDPAANPEMIRLLAYWYGTSERPNARVREVISQDMLGVGYWRFDDTYNYQIGVAANGDQPGDMKWEFGGAVLRVLDQGINEYAVYGSFWVLLPDGDAAGPRIAPPFQDATGASINGGPIVTLAGQDVDLLFLPRGIRPGDVLEVGDSVAFSGHVGPPLDSRVQVTITSPSGVVRTRTWHANRIGWLYDPTFDFVANEPGRWRVEVSLLHDRPYVGNGVVPTSHNTGTAMGSGGQFSFYVVEPGSTGLHLDSPAPGVIVWPEWEIVPITIQGQAPLGTTAVYYTIYDKGVVMGQGQLTPGPGGAFSLVYDAKALQQLFSMVSLTAHEGLWEGLADEVDIRFLAVGPGLARAAAVTLVGEAVFVLSGDLYAGFLPAVFRP